MSGQYAGTEFAALAQATNYYRGIVEQFAPYLGRRVVEVGAGVGTFAETVLAATTVQEMVLVEPTVDLASELGRRFEREPRIRLIHAGPFETLPLQSDVDAVVMVNVLEHVEDDTGLLRAARACLGPRGFLLVFVPALPWCYGTLDAEFGHVRRYTKRSLRRCVDAAGFRPMRLHYFNLPGVFSWWVVGKILRQRRIDPRQVRLYDRFVMPLTLRCERRLRPAIGQSLVLVASAAEQ
jgi:SAM-dependent methyltransferase